MNEVALAFEGKIREVYIAHCVLKEGLLAKDVSVKLRDHF